MHFHYFDIVVGVIVLLLGLKGIINGFFKELFGLIGIIGGIFIASRFGSALGESINDLIFHFDNQPAISFTGFLITLALFWVSMILLGALFKKISKESGLGPVDKLFGFIVGSGKFFLIAAVIIFAMNNVKAIHNNLAPVMEESILFPVLVEVGDVIMHIDPTEITSDINASVTESTKKAADAATKAVSEQAKAMMDEVKTKLPEHQE